MRKFFMALAAGLLAAAVALPASAADFKYTGIFRIRGVTGDNADRNDSNHDGVQGFDSVARPRFTATSEGGKVWALYELDFITGNNLFGARTGRTTVGTNRWLVDFAIPGTTLRARFGKTDYTDPTGEIYTSFGRARNDGIGIYGKLTNNLTLSAFHIKTSEDVGPGNRFTTQADDSDDYLVAVKWQAAPNVSLTPWVALSRQNDDKASSQIGYEYYYFALTAAAKVGIFSGTVTGIFQTGDIAQFNRVASGSQPSDVDLEAWALLVRTWLTFGKLKVGFDATLMTGDDDEVTATGNQAQQKDKELSRFVLPALGGKGWIMGPQILTARWENLFSLSARVPGTVTNVNATGDGRRTQLNGLVILMAKAEYRATPTLRLLGAVSHIRSESKAPNICSDTNGNGVCDDGEPSTTEFSSKKDFGTEVDLGFRYHIYKSLELRGVFAYLFAGDYGQARGAQGFDDTWQLMFGLRHTF